jgi:hypothetical protein
MFLMYQEEGIHMLGVVSYLHALKVFILRRSQLLAEQATYGLNSKPDVPIFLVMNFMLLH